MINYCCSRCGEKVPRRYAYQVDVSDSNSIEILKRKKSYILCLACNVELESWMEEDEKEENQPSSIGTQKKIKLNHPSDQMEEEEDE